MGALFGDDTVLYHQYPAGRTNGGQPVGDDQCRAASGQTVKGALDAGFRHAVQRGGGLIQYQNGRGLQKHPGDGHPLLLPAGEQRAPLTHIGVEPVGHGADIVVDLRLPRRLLYLGVGGVGAAVANILADGVGKQEHVLLHDADGPAQGALGNGADITAVDVMLPLSTS